ncbi:MAG: hypothetical protein ABEJ31_10335 [Haloarculaceae archaeon]
MATVTTSLAERAESIFSDLGYVVSDEGAHLRAERKWRVVHVAPVDEPAETPDTGELRCFVTWKERAPEVHDSVAERDPDCEWAVIGIDADGDYEVYRPSAGALAA